MVIGAFCMLQSLVIAPTQSGGYVVKVVVVTVVYVVVVKGINVVVNVVKVL